MSTPTSDNSHRPVHLLVLVHGMWGNPKHLAELLRIMRETKGAEAVQDDDTPATRLEILLAETTQDEGTYDGIDWGGERVAQEVMDKVDALRETGSSVTKLSVTGYSLGGLFARYMVGILYQRGFFDTVEAANFNTFATPHLGLPRYNTIMSRTFARLGPSLLSRTGAQFYLEDKWSPRGRPLIEVLADPDQVFYKGLKLFQNLTIYVNAVNDLTVPFVTNGIEEYDPFVAHAELGMQVEYLEGYKPIIKSWTLPDEPPPKPKKSAVQRTREALTAKNPGPPFLQFGFPGNVAMYVVLPFLMPVLITLAYTRLSLSARKSRTRVKTLEADETYASRLVHAVAKLERSLEDKVADMVDGTNDSALQRAVADDGSAPASGLATPALAPGASSSATLAHGEGETFTAENTTKAFAMALAKAKGKHKEMDAGQPVLTDVQRRIARSLNALPRLQKQLAYIHPMRNAHATIVSRDVKNFAFHRDGEGVIRHWADHFIL